ncbi:MAG: VTT domain-containing protein [Rubrivivax sp.]|nr:VTT domain-containing protein [Rubrivivax sp.]
MLTTLAFSAASLDQALTQWVAAYGIWALGIVALIIFAETGLVIAPFLPGDSLLFLTGTVVAANAMDVHSTVFVLVLAAIAGDALNFAVGRRAAAAVVARLKGRWLRQSHLDATHRYFERFGPSTIVVARFVPIVRTLAPFLAGAGTMSYSRFAVFNIAGAVAWVSLLVYAGAFLGSRPFVRDNLSAITLGIVALSVLPMVATGARALRAKRAGASTSPQLDIAVPEGLSRPARNR